MHKNLQQYEFIARLESFNFIDEIWLFGSRARGDNQERSDIDLAIICPTATDCNWLEVLDVVEKADTLLKIDCIRFDKLPEDSGLRQNIFQFKKVLYKK